MLKIIIAVVALIYVVAAVPCTVSYSQNGNTFYAFVDWLNGTDQYGDTWFFRLCNPHDETDSPCAQLDSKEHTVSVCQKTAKGGFVARGYDDTIQYSMTSDDDFEIMYGNEGEPAFKTAIELYCSESESVTVQVIDEATTVINYYTEQACKNTVLDGIMPEPQTQHVIYFPGSFFLICILASICACCCCTCLVRRRKRCQQRKDIQMKQFSSVAFQPIPQTNAVKANTTVPAQVPAYNPYVQPQFVYYYPSSNGVAPFAQPQIEVSIETQNDETIARNLQAQFDQETRN